MNKLETSTITIILLVDLSVKRDCLEYDSEVGVCDPYVKECFLTAIAQCTLAEISNVALSPAQTFFQIRFQ